MGGRPKWNAFPPHPAILGARGFKNEDRHGDLSAVVRSGGTSFPLQVDELENRAKDHPKRLSPEPQNETESASSKRASIMSLTHDTNE